MFGPDVVRDGRLTIAGWIALLWSVALVAVALSITSNAVSNVLTTPPTCTSAAAKQLPVSLVEEVNAIEASHRIVVPNRRVTATVLQSRSASGGTAYALASFEPRFCGFDVGLAYNYKSNQAALDRTWQNDQVIYVIGGKPAVLASGATCVSNSVPTARTVNGVIQVSIDCDRLYPDSTLLQTTPRLQQLP